MNPADRPLYLPQHTWLFCLLSAVHGAATVLLFHQAYQYTYQYPYLSSWTRSWTTTAAVSTASAVPDMPEPMSCLGSNHINMDGVARPPEIRSSIILRITYLQSSATRREGPSGRRPPGMWRSPSRPPHGSSESHEMLKRNDKYHSIADDVPIPKM